MGTSSSKKKSQVKPLNDPYNAKVEDSREYNEEAKIGQHSKSLNAFQMKKATSQMENCVCKIKLDNEKTGTGFFCLIPFPKKSSPLQVLITCNHVLNEQNLLEGAKIDFSLNNEKDQKSITISNSRKTFTDHGKDITFIEIKPEDDIEDKSILAIDENMLEDDFKQIYEKNDVYMIHYEEGKEVKHSLGEIIYIDENNYTINHNCKTEKGSSGGPIINLNNFNVIGVHKGSNNIFNLGTLLKIPIDEFYKSYKDNKDNNDNKEEKENITSRSLNKENPKKEDNKGEENKSEDNRKEEDKKEKEKKKEDKNPKSNSRVGKMSVILEDEKQNDYTFICFKSDIFSSLEKKLYKQEPSLRNKNLYYTINNKEINVSKTIEENNISDGSIIIFYEKISVIIEDENQKDYSFICKKTDIFSSLEEKLFKKEPSLRNKEHYYTINDKEINISKTIEENNIDDGSTIYYKTRIENNNEIGKENNGKKSEVINQVEISNVNVVNTEKEKKIIGNKISVIIEDENQNAYSLICRTTDKFPSLEKKLFKKFPKLKDYRYYYTINNKNVSFLKTLEENGITDGSTINCYKINDEDIEDEFMVVTIQTTNQDINRPIACKKTDNFKFLEEKLYEKNPDLRNKTLTYLCGGNNLDVKKTLEENKIKNYDVILINIEEEGTTIIK